MFKETLTIKIESDPNNPLEPFMAWIEGDEYKGTIVTGHTIGECVKELGISLIVKEDHDAEIELGKL